MKLVVALSLSFAWVKCTRIGPVVWVVNEDRGWGIHTGDAWALAPLAIVLMPGLLGRMAPLREDTR